MVARLILYGLNLSVREVMELLAITEDFRDLRYRRAGNFFLTGVNFAERVAAYLELIRKIGYYRSGWLDYVGRADYLSLPCRLFHFHRPFQGKHGPHPERRFAGHGSGRSSASDLVFDHIFHRFDLGAPGCL